MIAKALFTSVWKSWLHLRTFILFYYIAEGCLSNNRLKRRQREEHATFKNTD